MIPFWRTTPQVPPAVMLAQIRAAMLLAVMRPENVDAARWGELIREKRRLEKQVKEGSSHDRN